MNQERWENFWVESWRWSPFLPWLKMEKNIPRKRVKREERPRVFRKHGFESLQLEGSYVGDLCTLISIATLHCRVTFKVLPSLCRQVSYCTDALSFIQPILFASTISQALAFLHSVTVLICPRDTQPCMQTVLLYFQRYSVVFFKKRRKKEERKHGFPEAKAIRLHSFITWWAGWSRR